MANPALKLAVERIEALEAQKADIADEVSAEYAAAKAQGLDTKALKRVIYLRKQDSKEVEEFDTLVEQYLTELQ